MHKKGRLEVLLDDAYWPAFSTVRARSSHAQWEYIGEGFVKELDFGRVWLRLNEADEGDKDDVIAEYKGDAKKFLDDALVSHVYFAKRGISLISFDRMDQLGSSSWTKTTSPGRQSLKLKRVMYLCPSSSSQERALTVSPTNPTKSTR